jgi:mannose PTS system EIIC component
MEVALLAAIVYFVTYAGNVLIGQPMIDRPLVVGALTGLVMGDLSQGIIMGATLEAIFMGAVYIGGQLSAEPAAATVFSVTFAIREGIGTSAALAIAVPIGILSAFISMFIFNVVMNAFVPLMDKYAAENNSRGIVILHYACWFFRFLVVAILMYVAVLVGSAPVKAFVDNIPSVVMRGLKAAGSFLPAVGFAILLKMLWSKELGIYFLLGFVLVIYLKLPLIAVSVIALFLIIVQGSNEWELTKLKHQGLQPETKNDELEDFLK